MQIWIGWEGESWKVARLKSWKGNVKIFVFKESEI